MHRFYGRALASHARDAPTRQGTRRAVGSPGATHYRTRGSRRQAVAGRGGDGRQEGRAARRDGGL